MREPDERPQPALEAREVLALARRALRTAAVAAPVLERALLLCVSRRALVGNRLLVARLLRLHDLALHLPRVAQERAKPAGIRGLHQPPDDWLRDRVPDPGRLR